MVEQARCEILNSKSEILNFSFHTLGLDLAGSLTATGGVGAVLSSTSFTDAYCLLPNASSIPFTFSTKAVDSSGLSYYGFRFYNAEMGRWLSRDPIREKGGENLYEMCSNNLINKNDLLGLAPSLARKLYCRTLFVGCTAACTAICTGPTLGFGAPVCASVCALTCGAMYDVCISGSEDIEPLPPVPPLPLPNPYGECTPPAKMFTINSITCSKRCPDGTTVTAPGTIRNYYNCEYVWERKCIPFGPFEFCDDSYVGRWQYNSVGDPICPDGYNY
jgi:RHS repeat-associated protein